MQHSNRCSPFDRPVNWLWLSCRIRVLATAKFEKPPAHSGTVGSPPLRSGIKPPPKCATFDEHRGTLFGSMACLTTALGILCRFGSARFYEQIHLAPIVKIAQIVPTGLFLSSSVLLESTGKVAHVNYQFASVYERRNSLESLSPVREVETLFIRQSILPWCKFGADACGLTALLAH